MCFLFYIHSEKEGKAGVDLSQKKNKNQNSSPSQPICSAPARNIQLSAIPMLC